MNDLDVLLEPVSEVCSALCNLARSQKQMLENKKEIQRLVALRPELREFLVRSYADYFCEGAPCWYVCHAIGLRVVHTPKKLSGYPYTTQEHLDWRKAPKKKEAV